MIQLEKINQGNCRRSQPQNTPTEVSVLLVKDPEPGEGGGRSRGRPLTWPGARDALLGAASPDLPQRLVLVPALPHVLVVDDVVWVRLSSSLAWDSRLVGVTSCRLARARSSRPR